MIYYTVYRAEFTADNTSIVVNEYNVVTYKINNKFGIVDCMVLKSTKENGIELEVSYSEYESCYFSSKFLALQNLFDRSYNNLKSHLSIVTEQVDKLKQVKDLMLDNYNM